MTHEPKPPAEAGLGDEVQDLAEAGEVVQAWEEIEAGRFMPRRIRGSMRGRSLG